MKSRKYNQKQRRSRKRGGSYYKYNCNPKIFTNTTSQLFGPHSPRTNWSGLNTPSKLIGGDARFNLFQPLTNLVQCASDSNTNMMNSWNGNYPVISSKPFIQPLNFK